MSKATVQAALGPVALRHVLEIRRKGQGDAVQGSLDEERYANIVLIICILSIVITAPLGAILISVTGTKLLTKTKQPVNTEGMLVVYCFFTCYSCLGFLPLLAVDCRLS